MLSCRIERKPKTAFPTTDLKRQNSKPKAVPATIGFIVTESAILL
jgi:hypothetical protein